MSEVSTGTDKWLMISGRLWGAPSAVRRGPRPVRSAKRTAPIDHTSPLGEGAARVKASGGAKSGVIVSRVTEESMPSRWMAARPKSLRRGPP